MRDRPWSILNFLPLVKYEMTRHSASSIKWERRFCIWLLLFVSHISSVIFGNVTLDEFFLFNYKCSPEPTPQHHMHGSLSAYKRCISFDCNGHSCRQIVLRASGSHHNRRGKNAWTQSAISVCLTVGSPTLLFFRIVSGARVIFLFRARDLLAWMISR
jgi:hypothetical protein